MKAIVFDLDGTLIDSAPDIHAAVNRMLADEGQAPLDLRTVISFIGHGLPKLVERVMRARGIDATQHARLTDLTLGHYNAASADLTVLYPGLMPALRQVRAEGYALGLCTNKPEAPARQILGQFGLADLFDVVIGGDSLPVRKPDPAPLLRAFEALGATGATGRLYVGDSEVDAETADRAGVPFALFTEGYRKTPAAAMPHLHLFDHFDQFPGLVADHFVPSL